MGNKEFFVVVVVSFFFFKAKKLLLDFGVFKCLHDAFLGSKSKIYAGEFFFFFKNGYELKLTLTTNFVEKIHFGLFGQNFLFDFFNIWH